MAPGRGVSLRGGAQHGDAGCAQVRLQGCGAVALVGGQDLVGLGREVVEHAGRHLALVGSWVGQGSGRW